MDNSVRGIALCRAGTQQTRWVDWDKLPPPFAHGRQLESWPLAKEACSILMLYPALFIAPRNVAFVPLPAAGRLPLSVLHALNCCHAGACDSPANPCQSNRVLNGHADRQGVLNSTHSSGKLRKAGDDVSADGPSFYWKDCVSSDPKRLQLRTTAAAFWRRTATQKNQDIAHALFSKIHITSRTNA